MTQSETTAVQRESRLGPNISGSYHHFGQLVWNDDDDYSRPECPVSQLGSIDRKAGCTQTAERITDENGRGSWHCGWHGPFRVFGYPTENTETEQTTLIDQ